VTQASMDQDLAVLGHEHLDRKQTDQLQALG
jgi:hypothetical protein